MLPLHGLLVLSPQQVSMLEHVLPEWMTSWTANKFKSFHKRVQLGVRIYSLSSDEVWVFNGILISSTLLFLFSSSAFYTFISSLLSHLSLFSSIHSANRMIALQLNLSWIDVFWSVSSLSMENRLDLSNLASSYYSKGWEHLPTLFICRVKINNIIIINLFWFW